MLDQTILCSDRSVVIQAAEACRRVHGLTIRMARTIWTIWEWDCPVVFADPDRVLVAQVLGPDRDLGLEDLGLGLEDLGLDPEEQDSAGPDLDFEFRAFSILLGCT